MFSFILLSMVLAALLSWYLIPRILTVAYKKNLFDMPDKRKVHNVPIPRLGGISFLPTLFVTLFMLMSLRYRLGFEVLPSYVHYILPEFYALATGLTILYLVGIGDDLIGLRHREKFGYQFIVACLFPLSGLWINNFYGLFGLHVLPAWFGIPFTILLIIFILNSINLIDGIDGLASGISIAALAVLGILFLRNDLWIYSMLAFSMLGILIPFFYFNVFGLAERQRKIFMGDTGSLTLGYILAFLAIRYASVTPQLLPFTDGAIMVAFSTLAVPMFDVLRVMFVRWRAGQGLFTADRNHIHHKLIDLGLTFRQTRMVIIFLACGFATVNILLTSHVNINILLLGDIFLWFGINIVINRLLSR